MARLRTGQKVARVVRFLLGLRDVHIAEQLVRHGFSQEELDKGWLLVRNAAGQKLATAAPHPVDPRLIDDLDAWENLWFPIAAAALAHRQPDIHDAFFRNLKQTTGPEVVLSVSTFVRRYDGLGETAAGQAARDLLAERGITDAVIDEAKAMLERVTSLEAGDSVDTAAYAGTDSAAVLEAQRVAEEAMWRWYLEWSTIARTVIKDHALLRRLGYRRTRRGTEDDFADASDSAADALDDELALDDDPDLPSPSPSEPEARPPA